MKTRNWWTMIFKCWEDENAQRELREFALHRDQITVILTLHKKEQKPWNNNRYMLELPNAIMNGNFQTWQQDFFKLVFSIMWQKFPKLLKSISTRILCNLSTYPIPCLWNLPHETIYWIISHFNRSTYRFDMFDQISIININWIVNRTHINFPCTSFLNNLCILNMPVLK